MHRPILVEPGRSPVEAVFALAAHAAAIAAVAGTVAAVTPGGWPAQAVVAAVVVVDLAGVTAIAVLLWLLCLARKAIP